MFLGLNMRCDRVLLLVLDSVGIGEMPDAEFYGDKGANTLSNTSKRVGGLYLPNMQMLGLGNLTEIIGVPPTNQPKGFHMRLAEKSQGKDTTVGHWEMAGLVLERPFALFPSGFPQEIIEEFERRTGLGTLGNYASSGTEIIEKLGSIHQATGKVIVYTSADSVFQVAAHEDVIPLQKLYSACEVARDILDKWHVARVIARPFIGSPGNYKRTYNRKDFSMKPPEKTVLDLLVDAGIDVVGVGKIYDIFAGRGVTHSIHTDGNTHGLMETEKTLKDLRRGLVFTNLVDFDMVYGHRRNPEGYAKALEEVDRFLPRLFEAGGDNTLIMITADHGCDPTATWSTDHTREYVPLLVWHAALKHGKGLDDRSSYADIGATIARIFGVGETRFGCVIKEVIDALS